MMLSIALLLVACLGMPLAYAWRLWRLAEPSRAAWLAAAAEATSIVAVVFMVGRWDVAGYSTLLMLAAIFLLAVLLSYRRHAKRPWRILNARPLWRSHAATLASATLLGALCIHLAAALMPVPASRDLAFPLRGGTFSVGQGGASRLLNHHRGHAAQRDAIDITAINQFGFRATGLLPGDLFRYAVYGAGVVSPCAGRVVAALNGLPDLEPPLADARNAAGNHVVIACEGIEVEMAHLQKDSLVVEAGDRLAIGDAVGRVGNSGNTTEPHLHIHATDPGTGRAVPITFHGRSLTRNSLFRS